jgi:hypothetical protein
MKDISSGAVVTERTPMLQPTTIDLDEVSLSSPSYSQQLLSKIKDQLSGVVVTERSKRLQAIVLDVDSPPPSCIQRLLCNCGPVERKQSGGINGFIRVSSNIPLWLICHPNCITSFFLWFFYV